MRTTSEWRVLIAVVVGAVLAAAGGCNQLRGGGGVPSGGGFKPAGAGDDDRSIIIVRGGSVTIEDGTPGNTRPWKMGGSKREWKQDHANGSTVKYFLVSARGAAGDCWPLRLVATGVAIEYTVDPKTTHEFDIGTVGSNGQKEPLVTSKDVDLDVDPKDNSHLVYDPKMGGVSKVTVGDDNGSLFCSFDPKQDVKPVIRLEPVR